ncbi:MAG: DUF3347 domain-containing protein [Acidobacteria bacterium]|nr:MAG: DUF3347 domain-containing protein [Acidobacteriota bacterium]REJ98247.1 MAG: DUF3347 domain-containing protein [Acidobacteriota bacterium]REK16991.1 MAG: DUF3347 domain-containing protein [Acidobacteriota bacterium]REK42901.1 MAG: DUF3347 domain-containing protein [Acidobacteriota bacterium]
MKKSIVWISVSVLFAGAALLFAACGQSSETSNMSSNEMPMNMDHNGMDHGDSPMKTDGAEFADQRNDQTSGVIDAYNQIKQALDANDKGKAANGATAMIAALQKFDSSKVAESKRKEYKEIFDTAKEHSEHIVKSDVDHQKEHFEELTTDIKDLLALVGAGKKAEG